MAKSSTETLGAPAADKGTGTDTMSVHKMDATQKKEHEAKAHPRGMSPKIASVTPIPDGMKRLTVSLQGVPDLVYDIPIEDDNEMAWIHFKRQHGIRATSHEYKIRPFKMPEQPVPAAAE
jgi:hypothetical protein